jgi:hypothetical protein
MTGPDRFHFWGAVLGKDMMERELPRRAGLSPSAARGGIGTRHYADAYIYDNINYIKMI